MGFWDDVARNLGFTSHQTNSRQTPRSEQPAQSGGLQRAPQPTRPVGQKVDMSGFQGGGGGGGRGGGMSMSRSAAPAVQPPPPKEVNVFEEFGRWAGDVGKNFNDFMNQPVYTPFDAFRDSAIEQGTKKGENMNPFAYDPKSDTWTLGSPFDTAKTLQPEHEKHIADTVEKKVFENHDPMAREAQMLTDEQWAQLDPEQQQGVIANWTLYQASLADKALNQKGGWDDDYTKNVKEIFGDANRGSDYYAPNLVRALNELGYTDKNSDLDYWLNGSTYSSYEDILGQTKGVDADARRNIYGQLEKSAVFDEEPVVAALTSGSNLIESLRNSAVLSSETIGYAGGQDWAGNQLSDDDAKELDSALDFMLNRENTRLLKTDKATADEFNANMAELQRKIDPQLINRYFMESLDGWAGDEFSLSRDEFKSNWLKEG